MLFIIQTKIGQMKILNLGILALIGVTACNQGEKKQASVTTAAKESTVGDDVTTDSSYMLEGEKSYQYLKNGDTISLTIEVKAGKVEGDLTYAWKEKDRNTGRIAGVLKDSVLLADYTFSSEGLQSVRQVAFKLAQDRAIEGYGPVEEKGGKMSFVEPDKLVYDEKFVLENVRD